MIEVAQITPRADGLRSVAKQWVGQTFFGTLMKQARESPLASEDSPLTGGRGGGAFGSLLDQHLSEAASNGVGGKLVDALVRQLGGGGRIDVKA